MLTEDKIRSAPSLDKPYKLYDSKGLYLLVQPSGAKWWRLRYRLGGKEKSLALGVYPTPDLETARERAEQARQLVATGKDPTEKDKPTVRISKANTFMLVGEEWLGMMAKQWDDKTTKIKRAMLSTHLYPAITELHGNKLSFGDMPVEEITSPQVFAVLKGIEAKGLVETTHRCKDLVAQILRYARVSRGVKTINAADDMRGALLTKKTRHHPAIVDPVEFGELLRTVAIYPSNAVTKAAMQLAPMLFVRPNELRHMEWSELDLTDRLRWEIPADKMKGPLIEDKQAHVVPLSTQALDILRKLQASTGCYKYVFPNERGCIYPMSEMALTQVLKRSGYKDRQSWHGFRATARTMLDEQLGMRLEWIEQQLAHEVKDPNGRAYNRTAFLKQRTAMMQVWADYLDGLRSNTHFVAASHGNLATA